MAGFNRKSDAGPFEGIPGKEQKVSQTVHRQPDESSALIYKEQEAASALIYAEKYLRVNLMPFELFGHNNVYRTEQSSIQSAQNISTQNYVGAAKVIDPLEIIINSDTSVIDSLSVAKNTSLTDYQYSMSYASLSFCSYNASGITNPEPLGLTLGSDLKFLFIDTDGEFLYPVVPITLGWKHGVYQAGAAEDVAPEQFGTSPILLPVLKKYSAGDPTSALNPNVFETGTFAEDDATHYLTTVRATLSSSLSASAPMLVTPAITETQAKEVIALAGASDAGGYGATWTGDMNDTMKKYEQIRGFKITPTFGGGTNPALLINIAFYDYSSARILHYTIMTTSTTELAICPKSQYDAGIFEESGFPIAGIQLFYIKDYTDAASFDSDKGWDDSVISDLCDVIIAGDDIAIAMNSEQDVYIGNTLYTSDSDVYVAGYPDYASMEIEGDGSLVFGYRISGLYNYSNLASHHIHEPLQSYLCLYFFTPGPFWLSSEGIVQITIEPPIGLEDDVTLSIGFKVYPNQADNTGMDWQGGGSDWKHQNVVTGTQIDTNTMTRQTVYLDSIDNYSNNIYDPALVTGSLARYYTCSMSGSGKEYEYKNISQGTNTGKDNPTTTTVNAIITAGVGLLLNKTPGADVYDVISNGGIDYTTCTINLLYTINSDYGLTEVNLDSSTYYLGLIELNDTGNAYRHYSPINIMKDFQKISFDSKFTLEKITLLSMSDTDIRIMVKSNHGVQYMKYIKVSKYPGSIFLPEAMRNSYILETHIVTSEGIDIEPIEYNQYEIKPELGLLTGVSVVKMCNIYEYDDYIVKKNPNQLKVELNQSSIQTVPASMVPENAVLGINDVTEFAASVISIPMLCHSYYYGLPGVDVIEFADGPLTVDSTTNISAYYYALNAFMGNNYLLHNLPRNPLETAGALLVMNMPSIDLLIQNYAILPEKLVNVLGYNHQQNSNSLGENTISIAERDYVIADNQLYRSAIPKLSKRDTSPMLNSYGDIYNIANYIMVAGDNGTTIYNMDQYGVYTLKTISGKLLCYPTKIGEDILFLCDNGIYTLNRDMIYEFDSSVDGILSKPISGKGYLCIAKTLDNFLDIRVSVDGTYTQLRGSDEEEIRTVAFSIKAFLVTNNGSVTQLTIPDTVFTDLQEAYIAVDNLNDDTLQVIYESDYITTGGGNSISYKFDYDVDTVATNVILKTCPLNITGEDGISKLIINKLRIGHKGGGTAVVNLYRTDTALWTSDSITLSTGANFKIVDIMPFDCDGVSVEITFTPTTNDFYVYGIYGIGTFEEEYELT